MKLKIEMSDATAPSSGAKGSYYLYVVTLFYKRPTEIFGFTQNRKRRAVRLLVLCRVPKMCVNFGLQNSQSCSALELREPKSKGTKLYTLATPPHLRHTNKTTDTPEPSEANTQLRHNNHCGSLSGGGSRTNPGRGWNIALLTRKNTRYCRTESLVPRKKETKHL